MICDKCSITCCFCLFGNKTLDISFLQKSASLQEREIRFKHGHSEDTIGVAMVVLSELPLYGSIILLYISDEILKHPLGLRAVPPDCFKMLLGIYSNQLKNLL